MIWSKVFSGQVCDPVTELTVTPCDEAVPLAVKVMANGEGGVAAVAAFR